MTDEPTLRTASNTGSVAHYKEYYLEDGDLHILIGSKMFKIHSYFFKRDSAKFRGELGASKNVSDGLNRPGSSSCPFRIDEATPEEFAKFLWLYYDTYKDVTTATLHDWISILKIAHVYDFAQIKSLAISSLEALSAPELSQASRIKLYLHFGIHPDFLVPHLAEMVLRDTYPSDEEQEELGVDLSTLIARARERFLVVTSGRKSTGKVNEENARDALLGVPGAEKVLGGASGQPNSKGKRRPTLAKVSTALVMALRHRTGGSPTVLQTPPRSSTPPLATSTPPLRTPTTSTTSEATAVENSKGTRPLHHSPISEANFDLEHEGPNNVEPFNAWIMIGKKPHPTENWPSFRLRLRRSIGFSKTKESRRTSV